MLNGALLLPHGQPLTHAGYITACQQLATQGNRLARLWVQVRKRIDGNPVVLCGQVVELDAGNDSGEWFKVQTDLSPLWVEGRNVRLCSGDGRCTCESGPRAKCGSGDTPLRAPLPGARQAEWKSGSAATSQPG